MISYENPGQNPKPSADPRPAKPGQEAIADVPMKPWLTASNKVGDLSRHESKHDEDPKKDPKHISKPSKEDGTRRVDSATSLKRPKP